MELEFFKKVISLYSLLSYYFYSILFKKTENIKGRKDISLDSAFILLYISLILCIDFIQIYQCGNK